MPVRQLILPNGKSGYQWGTHGKVYPTPEQALAQGRAIEAEKAKKKK
jgi:hypothetical protein